MSEKKAEWVSELDEITKQKTDPTMIKSGDFMTLVYTVRVEDVMSSDKSLIVTNVDTKDKFKVTGVPLIESAYSADRFTKEVKANQTEIIDRLMQSYNKVFTVCFDKQDKTERVLRGRLVKPDSRRGRSVVEDLEVSSGTPIREVDHRTLKWLIVDGVKFTVGKKDR